ncbi:MAG: PAS domain S-box protein [Gammaproteobacteria bacterium]
MTSLVSERLNSNKSHTFLREIIDRAPDGILITDRHNRIRSMNTAIEVMFDVKPNSSTDTPLTRLLSDACAQLVESEFSTFWTEGVSNKSLFGKGRNLIGRRSNGSALPIHIRCRCIEGETKGEWLIVSFIRDITVEVAVETELQKQNAHLKATIDYSPVGISMINSNFDIVDINPAFAKILGYEIEDIIGKKFSDFTHPDDIDSTEQAAYQNFLGGLDHYTLNKRYLHKNGHTVHATLTIGVVHDSFGQSEYAIANIEDMTQRIATQAQLKDQQNQLNHLERLCVLGEMSAGIAHEIDQPLTAISTYAQSAMRFMKADAAKPDRVLDALRHLSQEAHRAGAVVSRVRSLAKRRDRRNELIDCSSLVDDVEELIRSDAQSSQITVNLNLSRKLPPVLGDPVEIQQVMLNLIRNALDASRETPDSGSRQINIRTGLEDNNDIIVAVSDQGMGVDSNLADNLFRPFSTSKDTGMGLGLSISQSIVASHGGCLAYRNGRNGGATFYFTLPPAPEN